MGANSSSSPTGAAGSNRSRPSTFRRTRSPTAAALATLNKRDSVVPRLNKRLDMHASKVYHPDDASLLRTWTDQLPPPEREHADASAPPPKLANGYSVLIHGIDGSGRSTLSRWILVTCKAFYDSEENRRKRIGPMREGIRAHLLFIWKYLKHRGLDQRMEKELYFGLTKALKRIENQNGPLDEAVDTLKRFFHHEVVAQEWNPDGILRYVQIEPSFADLMNDPQLDRFLVGTAAASYTPTVEEILRSNDPAVKNNAESICELHGVTKKWRRVGYKTKQLDMKKDPRGKEFITMTLPVNEVVYCFSTSNFDQYLSGFDSLGAVVSEDEKFEEMNAFRDALEDWSHLLSCVANATVSFVVVLTKWDVFKAKIRNGRWPISKWLPEFQPGLPDQLLAEEDFATAELCWVEFIQSLILERMNAQRRSKVRFTRPVNLLDSPARVRNFIKKDLWPNQDLQKAEKTFSQGVWN
eukprot:TRINITY_DN6962_c0_g1_i1.p1 TRINITY_DN6962_c0_g1~~TRINITY_DN6962_c0_g1_i1.p1  ORF type:complete len:475 (-),score=125.61 TRINITY_DN6962_c0_g1_i1:141-1544(-)